MLWTFVLLLYLSHSTCFAVHADHDAVILDVVKTFLFVVVILGPWLAHACNALVVDNLHRDSLLHL